MSVIGGILGWISDRGARGVPSGADPFARRGGPDVRSQDAEERLGQLLRRMHFSARWTTISLRRLGLVGMAILFSTALSIASFYTTLEGVSNFVGSSLMAMLLAIGIQGTLYIASWILAQELANDAAAAAAQEQGRRSWLRRLRIPHFTKLLMLLTCMFISVFFSFDSLYDRVFVLRQQTLVNMSVARSEFTTMFKDVETAMRTYRSQVLSELQMGAGWRAYATALDRLLATVDTAKETISREIDTKRAALETELENTRAQLASKQQSLAQIDAQLAVLAPKPVPVDGEDPQLKARIASVQAEIDDMNRRMFDLKAKMDVEEGVGGTFAVSSAIASRPGAPANAPAGRRPKGKGPVWMELNAQYSDLKAQLPARQQELSQLQHQAGDAQRQAVDTQSQRGSYEAQRNQLKGDVDILSQHATVVNDQLTALNSSLPSPGTGGAEGGAVTDSAGSLVAQTRNAKSLYLGTGSQSSYTGMVNGCLALADVVRRHPQLNGGDFDCDTSAFAGQADRLVTIDDALTKFSNICKIDDAFNAAPDVSALVARSRGCLSQSQLPANDLGTFEQRIDRVERVNSPDTSHFERTMASLQRGDHLAWVALAIAVAIDGLVFIAAVMGARAFDSILGAHLRGAGEAAELAAADHVTLVVYADDPVDIRRAKLFLSVITIEAGPARNSDYDRRYVINLSRFAAGIHRELQNIINIYSIRGLVKPTGRPNQFEVEDALIRHFCKLVGEWERDQATLYGRNRPRQPVENHDGESHGWDALYHDSATAPGFGFAGETTQGPPRSADATAEERGAKVTSIGDRLRAARGGKRPTPSGPRLAM